MGRDDVALRLHRFNQIPQLRDSNTTVEAQWSLNDEAQLPPIPNWNVLLREEIYAPEMDVMEGVKKKYQGYLAANAAAAAAAAQLQPQEAPAEVAEVEPSNSSPSESTLAPSDVTKAVPPLAAAIQNSSGIEARPDEDEEMKGSTPPREDDDTMEGAPQEVDDDSLEPAQLQALS